jgi:hypothetical protein
MRGSATLPAARAETCSGRATPVALERNAIRRTHGNADGLSRAIVVARERAQGFVAGFGDVVQSR